MASGVAVCSSLRREPPPRSARSPARQLPATASRSFEAMRLERLILAPYALENTLLALIYRPSTVLPENTGSCPNAAQLFRRISPSMSRSAIGEWRGECALGSREEAACPWGCAADRPRSFRKRPFSCRSAGRALPRAGGAGASQVGRHGQQHQRGVREARESAYRVHFGCAGGCSGPSDERVRPCRLGKVRMGRCTRPATRPPAASLPSRRPVLRRVTVWRSSA